MACTVRARSFRLASGAMLEIAIAPDVTRCNPRMARMRVVLPEPLSPTRPKQDPVPIFSVTPSTALSFPNRTVTSLIATAEFMPGP